MTLRKKELKRADRALRERDLELVRSALTNERDSIERLAARLVCVPRILAAINERRGGLLTSHDIEDLAQDTLVLVWRKLAVFAGTTTIESWLYRFCLLEFLNRVRRHSRHSNLVVSDPRTMEEELEGPTKARPLAYEHVEHALEGLGVEAETIRLKHFHQLTFDEIGDRLGISPNTAKTRYYRGIAWLQRELAPVMWREERDG